MSESKMMRLSRRSALIGPVGLALTVALRTRAVTAGEPPLIEIHPLGVAPGDAELDGVLRALRAFYEIRIAVRSPVSLPKQAFYPQRGRYRAEKLLDFLAARKDPSARVALGLTSVDISTTKGKVVDWGVLGLATIDGKSAVLSSFRCHRGARNGAHARQRFAKTAVHELGHAFGLDHCPVRGCLMHDGEGSVRTTDEEDDLCPETRSRLSRDGLLVSDAKSPFV